MKAGHTHARVRLLATGSYRRPRAARPVREVLTRGGQVGVIPLRPGRAGSLADRVHTSDPDIVAYRC
jgi:hypothetical protein